MAVPEHRFVTAGEVAYDCELLCVSYAGLEHALPDGPTERVRCAVPRAVALQVHWVGCVPISEGDGRPPTKEELNAAGRDALRAAWIIAREIVAAYRAGEFASGDDTLVLTGQLPVGPEGGLVGIRQDLSVQV